MLQQKKGSPTGLPNNLFTKAVTPFSISTRIGNLIQMIMYGLRIYLHPN